MNEGAAAPGPFYLTSRVPEYDSGDLPLCGSNESRLYLAAETAIDDEI